MNTHVILTTIEGEEWILNKNDIRSVVYIDTPEQWKETVPYKKIVLMTTFSTMEDGKPMQVMLGDSWDDISLELTGERVTTKNLKLS